MLKLSACGGHERQDSHYHRRDGSWKSCARMSIRARTSTQRGNWASVSAPWRRISVHFVCVLAYTTRRRQSMSSGSAIGTMRPRAERHTMRGAQSVALEVDC